MTPEQLATRRRYQKLQRFRSGGRKVRIPADRVWRHVDQLRAEGWNYDRIAAAAGVTPEMLHQRLPNIHQRRARDLLAVDRQAMLKAAKDTAQVPAIGAQRRIQALMAIGWAGRDILPATCMAGQVIRPGRPTVSALTWRNVRDAYDRLAMDRGTSLQAANRARREGWPPPLCWDDDTIDDPAAEPNRPRTRDDDRHGPHAERLDQVAAWTAEGITAQTIADRLGVTRRTVERLRAELAETQ